MELTLLPVIVFLLVFVFIGIVAFIASRVVGKRNNTNNDDSKE